MNRKLTFPLTPELANATSWGWCNETLGEIENVSWWGEQKSNEVMETPHSMCNKEKWLSHESSIDKRYLRPLPLLLPQIIIIFKQFWKYIVHQMSCIPSTYMVLCRQYHWLAKEIWRWETFVIFQLGWCIKVKHLERAWGHVHWLPCWTNTWWWDIICRCHK